MERLFVPGIRCPLRVGIKIMGAGRVVDLKDNDDVYKTKGHKLEL